MKVNYQWPTAVVSSVLMDKMRCAMNVGDPCDTDFMVIVDPTPRLANDPKSVKVHLATGEGMEIEWKDGHRSAYTFKYLRDACPCALCEDERGKSGRKPGEPEKPAPGTLPMFKPGAKPLAAEAVGKYALRFSWNDNHDLGIYSWAYLREACPCGQCRDGRGRK